jgi:hypothetical protein
LQKAYIGALQINPVCSSFYNQNNINTNIFSVFLMFKRIIQKIDLTKIYKKKQKKMLITEMYLQSEI